jgi:histidine triad (HIT) family protein
MTETAGRLRRTRRRFCSGRREPLRTVAGLYSTQQATAMTTRTLFQRIEAGEIPAEMVYEDDVCFAFRDIAPQAPTHILIVPRKPIPTLDDLTLEDAQMVGRLVLAARHIAAAEGLTGGYRTVFNCGADASQTVFHIHLHLLGGRKLGWPPG